MELRELNPTQIEQMKTFFYDIFTKEPWYDDWSDPVQFHAYITDLIGNPNSLSLGLFENDEMVGLAMGNIKHWYSGTEYCIDELCIKTQEQGHGYGTKFVELIEEYLSKKDIHHIFLQTESSMPAYEFYQKRGFQEAKEHVSFWKKF